MAPPGELASAELIETENDMQAVAYLLPALGCVAMMGAMMWMMRGTGNAAEGASDDHQREIAALRAEIESLDRGRAPGDAEPERG